MKWIFPGLILSLAALSVPAQPQAGPALPTVDEIVARHVQATGGRAAWEKLAAQTRKGVALPDSANLPLESASQPPNQWTFTIRMPNGRTLKHGFDGAQGWEDRGRAARMERDAALEETLIYDAFWVLRIKDHFPEPVAQRHREEMAIARST